MLIGAHSIIYSANSEADRVFLRDVLGLPNVDVGDGWLIFGLPPSEVAVHPSNENNLHELYLMCEDIEAFVMEMSTHDILCGPVQDQGWGLLTELTLPGGGRLGVYQPRHARPASAGSARVAGTTARSATKKRARTSPKGRTKTGKSAKARVRVTRSRTARKSTAGKSKTRRARR